MASDAAIVAWVLVASLVVGWGVMWVIERRHKDGE